jgi:ribosome assembly protein YihI (activator of Der GTPase)
MISKAILDRAEDIYQAMKGNRRNFAKKYKKEAENVMRGRAMNIAKSQVQTMNEDRLKEIVKKRLSTPPIKEKFSKEYDDNPALKGGQKGLPDELQKSIIKKSVTEETDYEGEMAKSELRNMIQNAEELFNMLDEDTQLEAWVQSKITKAADYISSVIQYLGFQAENKPEIDERTEYTLDK